MEVFRGLTVFISDIRACTNQEQEQQRVEKEMAHIRGKFSAVGKMDAYDRKKYMWKLLYMFMLGYEVDFGHMEAVNLVTAGTYGEKSCGYVACSLLLSEHQDLLRLIIQAIKNDLSGRNEVFQCLALTCIANCGGQEFAESLSSDVQKILVSGSSRSFVKKKAALCLLRLFRQYSDIMSSESWAPRIINLLDEKHFGVVTSVLSLLLGLVSSDPNGYEEAVPKAIKLLNKICILRECEKEYTYYKTPSPWIHVKLLRLLQYFPPPKDRSVRDRLQEVLNKILTRTEVTKSVNKNNADHGILFEAVNLVIHYCSTGWDELKGQAITLLGRFISVREPNIRYLGLDSMSRMTSIPDSLPTIKKHQNTIQFSLKDADISIRKRAVDLLYTMCDQENAKDIVSELVIYLETAEFAIREELVLKIAILAERFAPKDDRKWYLDVILKLISLAGDHISDDIWYRVVQIITNHEELHAYAAATVLEALKVPAAHETAVKVGGYLLGEFGHLLKESNVAGIEIFDVLHKRFLTSSLPTRALLLSSYMKLSNMFPELMEHVMPIFEGCGVSMDSEIQQRAVEYLSFEEFENKNLVTDVWEMMPAFPERESKLVKRVKKAVIASEISLNDGKKNDDDEEDEDEEDDDDEEDEDEVPQSKKGKPASIPPNKLVESSAAKAAPVASSKSASDDFLGLSAPATAKTSVVDNFFSGPSLIASAAVQNLDKLRYLYTSNQGIFYESNGLQLGVKMQVESGSQCKLILYYINKDERNEFSDISVSLVPSNKVRVQINPESISTIAPRQQLQQYFLIHCLQPFAEPPQVTINFTVQKQVLSASLILPVCASKFISPCPIDPQPFVAAWKATGNELVEIFRSFDAINIDEIRTKLSTGMGFHLVDNLDKNPAANVVCSGTFNTSTKNSAGDFVTMPIYLRVETNSSGQGFRITIRSGHKLVSDAVKSSLLAIFGVDS